MKKMRTVWVSNIQSNTKSQRNTYELTHEQCNTELLIDGYNNIKGVHKCINSVLVLSKTSTRRAARKPWTMRECICALWTPMYALTRIVAFCPIIIMCETKISKWFCTKVHIFENVFDITVLLFQIQIIYLYKYYSIQSAIETITKKIIIKWIRILQNK